MAKIKVGELRGLQKELINDVRTVNFKGLDIEIKQYLSITKKIELASVIYHNCTDDEDGKLVVNQTTRDIVSVYFITQYYTNLTLPQDVFEGYDLLVSTGLYDAIKENIQDEVNRIEEMVDDLAIKELIIYEQENNITYIIKQLLEELNNNIPTPEETKKLVEEVSKELENFDPKKIKYVNEFMKLNSGGK